jgi:hypothetical protein
MKIWTRIRGPEYDVGGFAHYEVIYVGDLSEVPNWDYSNDHELSLRYQQGDEAAILSWHKPRGRVALFRVSVGWNPRDAELIQKALPGLGVAGGNYDYLTDKEVRELMPRQALDRNGWITLGARASRSLGLPVVILYSSDKANWAAELSRLIAQSGVTTLLIEREPVASALGCLFQS